MEQGPQPENATGRFSFSLAQLLIALVWLACALGAAKLHLLTWFAVVSWFALVPYRARCWTLMKATAPFVFLSFFCCATWPTVLVESFQVAPSDGEPVTIELRAAHNVFPLPFGGSAMYVRVGSQWEMIHRGGFGSGVGPLEVAADRRQAFVGSMVNGSPSGGVLIDLTTGRLKRLRSSPANDSWTVEWSPHGFSLEPAEPERPVKRRVRPQRELPALPVPD